MKTDVNVIIPSYGPGGELRRLLEMLGQQTVPPARILIVNTEKQFFDEKITEGIPGTEVIHIRKEEFDHGGTRHMAAERLQGAFLLFLTQDAVPADTHLIEELCRPFARADVAAAYARQLPAGDCSPLERYARRFNYGNKSRIKTAEDLPVLGIKTFFCSNVCAMYRRTAYEELGGFERRTIFNEDMILAGKMIQQGKAVAYCAKARVIHSHNYSGLQQLRRNFDLGVSQAEHPEVFGSIPSESEGIRMIRGMAAWLLKTGKPWLLPKLILQSGCKYTGYRLGRNYRRLPAAVIRMCTMNREYWKQKETGIKTDWR